MTQKGSVTRWAGGAAVREAWGRVRSWWLAPSFADEGDEASERYRSGEASRSLMGRGGVVDRWPCEGGEEMVVMDRTMWAAMDTDSRPPAFPGAEGNAVMFRHPSG